MYDQFIRKIRCITQLAKMSIDPKFIEHTSDMFTVVKVFSKDPKETAPLPLSAYLLSQVYYSRYAKSTSCTVCADYVYSSSVKYIVRDFLSSRSIAVRLLLFILV